MWLDWKRSSHFNDMKYIRKRGISMLELRSIINLTGNRETYVKLREKMAFDILRRMYGRTFFYSIPILEGEMGFCIIESITYDRMFDTFIYVIKDCNTKHTYITDRCNLCLIEV